MIKTTKKLALPALLLAMLALAAPAPAEDHAENADGFGIAAFDGEVNANPQGDPYTQAGGHPFEASTIFRFNRYTHPQTGVKNWPEEPVKDTIVEVPAGLVGNPGAVPKCRVAEVMEATCTAGAQVGLMNVLTHVDGTGQDGLFQDLGVYSMVHPPDSPARFGVNFLGTFVAVDAKLRSDGDYGIDLVSSNISEGIAIVQVKFIFWGVPGDPRHDAQRWCPKEGSDVKLGCSAGTDDPEPLVTLPTACTPKGVGLTTTLRADSWFHPGVFDSASFESHLPPGFTADPTQKLTTPLPESQWGQKQGPSGCEELLFEPKIDLTPSTDAAEAASGLSVEVQMPDEGLRNPDFLSQSHVKRATVTLPEGLTVNPAAAEGLGYCTPAQLDRETYRSPLGAGCPAESRIGSVRIDTPLLEEPAEGSLFIAQQDDPRTAAPGAENPFDTDLAIYIVAKEPAEGILVKLAGKVSPNPRTGQLETTFGDPSAAEPVFRQLPQLPFTKFTLKFREGQRGALVSPPSCGTYQTVAEFTPYSNPSQTKTVSSPFTVSRGVGGGSCAAGGVPPFHPSYSAGSLNNNAKSYSPFLMRLTRQDGDQDMTRFSSVLPPGVLGKLAGVSKCPEASIAAAEAKTHTGRDELAAPTCPASSKIGSTLVGAGVGASLTYVPGSLYLAGPFNGDPLSVLAITPGVAGPFDVGTVVVREALTLNPETAEVEVDGSASEPIPHILKGIPLKVRDVRVQVDRDQFILNPTSCDPSSAKATLFGGYLDLFSSADDVPVSLSDRFQAANCASLGFKPRLAIKLKGGTRRGAHPALRAVLNARNADANIGAAVVTLPKSAFLDQAHIRTICTRVQFAAGEGNGAQCPKGARYGYARAFTPLLEEPVEGPVYLRSSNHKLPDLVAALHGLVDVDVVGRIDSFRGGIRSSFEDVPDAPVSKFVLTMQGGKKGLVVNSTDLCRGANRAKAKFTGQNGKGHDLRPQVRPTGCRRGSAPRGR